MALSKYHAEVSVLDWKGIARKIGIHPIELLLCVTNQDINFLVSINKMKGKLR